MSTESQHRSEVERGERFEFGKNWARFLSVLNDTRIQLAEKSLVDMLGFASLEGRTFLDVGSGSGLFSLAARRLGARVHSFDYDPQSCACTQELRRRYFPGSPDWTIERGSVLDRDYLARLGTFDVVYSWGVLHHTGRMWEALDNVKPLVKDDGLLFIAIYNDLGEITDRWERIKRRYNRLPTPLKTMYLLGLLSRQQGKQALEALRTGKAAAWLKTWTDYPTVSVRGMSRWRDEVDWYGGYPYERASIEAIADVYAEDGFKLTNLVDRSLDYGCNEFVFRRVAPAGTFVDFPIPGGLSFARRFGRRIVGPAEKERNAWWGRATSLPHTPSGFELMLFRDDRIVGPVTPEETGLVRLADGDEPAAAIAASKFFLIAAQTQSPSQTFLRERGVGWVWDAPNLQQLADNTRADQKGSPVFVFEGDRQLPWPYALHDDIRKLGDGRFSHWGTGVLFTCLDNVDPNTISDRLSLLIAPDENHSTPDAYHHQV